MGFNLHLKITSIQVNFLLEKSRFYFLFKNLIYQSLENLKNSAYFFIISAIYHTIDLL